HARVIAHRKDLHPTIASLIRAMRASTTASEAADPEHPQMREIDSVRSRLRAIMRHEAEHGALAGADRSKPDVIYRRLRSAALTGIPHLFESALSEMLALPISRPGQAIRTQDLSDLLPILKSLKLTVEQAYLLVSALQP